MSWDGYKEKTPLPLEPIRRMDSFIQRHWRVILFVLILSLLFVFPFVAPPDIPDFVLLDR